MSPPQLDSDSDDHVIRYNQLPLINEAYAILRKERGEPDVPLDDLVTPILQDPDVCALFRRGVTGEQDDPDRERFGFWIVHRHFNLEQGEHMISAQHEGQPGQITRPIPGPKQSTHIAERWDLSAEEIEFLEYRHDSDPYTDSSIRPPSQEFATEFQRLMSEKFRVSVFGLCLAPCEFPEGHVYLETTLDAAARSQLTTLMPATHASVAGSTTFQSAWSVLQRNGASIACKTGECIMCPGSALAPAQLPTEQPLPRAAAPDSFLLDLVSTS